jgi:hypothetical protein
MSFCLTASAACVCVCVCVVCVCMVKLMLAARPRLSFGLAARHRVGDAAVASKMRGRVGASLG